MRGFDFDFHALYAGSNMCRLALVLSQVPGRGSDDSMLPNTNASISPERGSHCRWLWHRQCDWPCVLEDKGQLVRRFGVFGPAAGTTPDAITPSLSARHRGSGWGEGGYARVQRFANAPVHNPGTLSRLRKHECL